MRDKRLPGGFEVALDALQRGNGKVVKHFTYFDSHENFFRETACTFQRNFYEIISDGNPYGLYFDVEQYSPRQV